MQKQPKRLKGLWRQTNFAKKMLKQNAIKKKFDFSDLIEKKKHKKMKNKIK